MSDTTYNKSRDMNDMDSNAIAASEVQRRLQEIMAAENPLLEAASPLLRVMADMKIKQVEGDMQSFRDMLVREVKIFQYLSEQAGIKNEHILATRYCLCTAIDEKAGNMDWAEGATAWASNSLLVVFHNETYGGEKFFQLLGRLAQNPDEHGDVLEVMYQIMGLGFEGRYKPITDGKRQLETIRHRVRTIINNRKGEPDYALSPHWKGETGGKLAIFRSIPVWVTASVLGLILFGMFGWYKYNLMAGTKSLEAKIQKVSETQTIAVKAAVPLRLAELLQTEVSKGVVKVSEGEGKTTVTFTGDNMFVPGQADINSNIKPTLDKVAAEINRVTGTVNIFGHTDNTPIKTGAFPSNQALSEKRAQNVATYLESVAVEAARLNVAGKGDSEPAAENNSVAGRAKNRRVEIVVIQ